MSKIDETIRKVAAGMQLENTGSAAQNTGPTPHRYPLPADPNCPICHGMGFVRQELNVDDPSFGKIQPCTCQQESIMHSAHERLARMSNLETYQQVTFETFNPQGRMGYGDDQINSLRYALSLSKHYAQTLKGWLLLMGGYGCGKTHLAVSVANFALSLGVPTLFLTVPDLLDWLRFSYDSSETTFEERFNEIRNVNLLVFDDLGTQNATNWAQEKLFQILNHRYVRQLPTVITTNLSLEDIEGRIRSRLEDPDMVTRVEILAPDFRSPVRETHNQFQISSLHLHGRQTFGNFSLREREKLPAPQQRSLEKAFKSAQEFAEHPHGWLVLTSSLSNGKTHLAASVGNYRQALGENPMYVSVPDLLDHLRATFSPNSTVSYDRLFEQVLTNRLLILDDFSTQSATPWAREKLYQIINYRYNAELPTVLVTPPIEDIDPRIRSRILDSHLVEVLEIEAPSYYNTQSSKGGPEKPRRPRRPSSLDSTGVI
jgi:DNA replication protein DnaC